MTPEDRLRAARASGLELPVFLYDGDCGFCRRWAEWLADRAGGGVPVMPFQSVDHQALGLAEMQLRAASYLVDAAGEVHGASDGFAEALRHGRRGWAALGWLARLPVVRSVARVLYRVVARNRHRLPAPR